MSYASNNNADLSRQFDGLDIKSPLEIRKNGPLMQSGLDATSGLNNNLLKRSSLHPDMNITTSLPFLGLPNRQYYTCFMNSILQSLIATPNLLQALCSLK